MDFTEYAMEQLVRDRLDALRTAAACRALTAPATARPSLRERVGQALIRIGGWLVATAPPRPAHRSAVEP